MREYADNRDSHHAQSSEACNTEAHGVADERRIPLIVTLLVMLPFGIALWVLLLSWTLPSLWEGMSWVIDHIFRFGRAHGA